MNETRRGILEILRTQVGVEQTGDNCYEIQPYWRGRLAGEITSFLEGLKMKGILRYSLSKVMTGEELLKALDKAQEGFDKAQEALNGAKDAYYKAWDVYSKSWVVYDKARAEEASNK